MNKKLIMIFVLFFFISLIFYNNIKTIQQYEIPIVIKITKNIGIIIDTDKLYYAANPGGFTTRTILLYNQYTKSVIVNLKAKDLSDWIIIQNKRFILKSNETRKIDIIVNPPSSTKIGEYNSTLIIIIKST
ncbi:MAG: hypothetical protein V1815_02785 [Candidatus Woesearchaeota archaeon]